MKPDIFSKLVPVSVLVLLIMACNLLVPVSAATVHHHLPDAATHGQ
jgi:hypothetical protein